MIGVEIGWNTVSIVILDALFSIGQLVIIGIVIEVVGRPISVDIWPVLGSSLLVCRDSIVVVIVVAPITHPIVIGVHGPFVQIEDAVVIGIFVQRIWDAVVVSIYNVTFVGFDRVVDVIAIRIFQIRRSAEKLLEGIAESISVGIDISFSRPRERKDET